MERFMMGTIVIGSILYVLTIVAEAICKIYATLTLSAHNRRKKCQDG